jgi:hypothetical protein
MSRIDELEIEVAKLQEQVKKCGCGKGKSKKGGTHTKITPYQMCMGATLIKAEKGNHVDNFRKAAGACSVMVKKAGFEPKELATEYIKELEKVKPKNYQEKIDRVKSSFGV